MSSMIIGMKWEIKDYIGFDDIHIWKKFFLYELSYESEIVKKI